MSDEISTVPSIEVAVHGVDVDLSISLLPSAGQGNGGVDAIVDTRHHPVEAVVKSLAVAFEGEQYVGHAQGAIDIVDGRGAAPLMFKGKLRRADDGSWPKEIEVSVIFVHRTRFSGFVRQTFPLSEADRLETAEGFAKSWSRSGVWR